MIGRILFVCGVVNSSLLFASPIAFLNRTEFDAAVGSQTHQSFEVPFADASMVSFVGFSVTEESAFANIKSRTDYVSAGNRALGFTWNGDTRLLFEFNPPITAFAADILDFGTCCSATSLGAVSADGEVDLVAAVGPDLPRGNLQFFGFQSAEPISQLSFSSQSLSDNDLIVFDRLSFQAVPEPSAGWLIGSWGLVVIGLRRWGNDRSGCGRLTAPQRGC